ncbi:Bug family tripartite tricarboxylate transporter substrate binding protein [Roseomonas sp. BN140053]|uniref:Bug family tripartite tricarboxylate transporter substrate binding protein n=1 Tax=Roseomonas sp. BN140053 TaxID=3391898 RepID=UPI0039EC69CC
MPVPRRLLPSLLAGLAALPDTRTAWAQQPASWPTRPVRMVVPFPPAGTTDLVARVLAERLQQRLGHPFPVENRAGAGGNIGSDLVAKGEADGSALLLTTIGTGAINYALYGARMPYKPEELTNVALATRVPNVIFVTPSLPVRSLPEFVAYARERPGKLNIGSAGAGTSLHLTGELLKLRAGLDMTHVPFRGAGPMLAEVMAGRVECGVDNLPSAIGHIKDGRLRALAVTTATRSPALPEVPTTAEGGQPGVEATAWFGIQVSARTPAPLVARIAEAVSTVLREPETAAKLADLGGLPPGLTPDGGTSPDSFDAFVKTEITRWAEIVRQSGATAE